MRRGASVFILLAAEAAAAAVSMQAQGEAAPKVHVIGTEFKVTLPGRRQLTGDELIGMILTLSNPGKARRLLRIDAVERDPKDPSGEITLYRLSVSAPNSNTWELLCGADADGVAMGFPLSGTWTPRGEHQPSEQAFSLTCTSSGIGKCVRMGYKPWKVSDTGISLWGLHQACTRMLRADYCGDGTPHTRDGIEVDVYDTLGIQSPQVDSNLTFEAAWTADGAACVRKASSAAISALFISGMRNRGFSNSADLGADQQFGKSTARCLSAPLRLLQYAVS